MLSERCSKEGGEFNEDNLLCNDVLITTNIDSSDRALCYFTMIFYGGYCWFIFPDEVDEKIARERVKRLLGGQPHVEFLKTK